jgi:hypothetical protein
MARLEYVLIAHMMIESKNMEDSFLILRKMRFLDFNQPVFHPGNRNPYKNLIQVGKKVIVEKELGGEIKFAGHGEVESIDEIEPQSDLGPDHTTEVKIGNYVCFHPPRMKNKQIRRKLLDLPFYHWYGAIRPIPSHIFYEIIDFCSKPNWPLFLSEIPSPSQKRSKSIDDLVNGPESEFLEFKSSMLHL